MNMEKMGMPTPEQEVEKEIEEGLVEHERKNRVELSMNEKKEIEEDLRDAIFRKKAYLNFGEMGFFKLGEYSGRFFLCDNGHIETVVFKNPNPEDSFLAPENGTVEGPAFDLSKDEAEALMEDVQRSLDHFGEESSNYDESLLERYKEIAEVLKNVK